MMEQPKYIDATRLIDAFCNHISGVILNEKKQPCKHNIIAKREDGKCFCLRCEKPIRNKSKYKII